VDETAGGLDTRSVALRPAVERALPRRRTSRTRSYQLGGAKGYVTSSAYEDGALAEVELRMAKQGSTLAGLMDATSTAWSVGLRHGAPLEVYVRKYAGIRAEPAGLTNDPEIPTATSPMDYVARRLAVDHMSTEDRQALGVFTTEERSPLAPGASSVIDLTGLSMSAGTTES
jgi:ribonucleoside-diphosphate reductase alpha chain